MALAATVTEAGVVSAELLSEKEMAAPPEGAAAERVTVQVLEAPELTVVGEHCRPETTRGAAMVREAEADWPLREAVTVAD